MTTLRTLLAGLLTALGLVVTTPAVAHACSCAVVTPAQQARGSDVVFTGTLTGVDAPPRRPIMSSGDPATYHFDVDEVFKGDVPSNARVTSAVSGASCGLEGMQVGREYVVFASGGHELAANLCGGTAPVDAAALDRLRAVTGPAHEPGPAASYPSDDGLLDGRLLTAGAGLVVLLGAAAALAGLALRRRRAVA